MPIPNISASCMASAAPLGNVQRLIRRTGGALLLMLVALAFVVPVHGMAPRRLHTGETQEGKASWYGAEQGRRTASGERFDPHALTAAHRSLPFNTLIRVTNELNGKSVEVRINDRGPFRHGRIVDVSEAAAEILDMKRAGTVPVTIEVLQLGTPTPANHG